MNSVVYALTGVHKPKVPPSALTDLANTFEVVRGAATTCGLQLRGAISLTLATNQGTATDAFEGYATGSDSAAAQLDRLSDAASATRDAHRQAASLVTQTNNSMDAIAATAARALADWRILLPILRERHIAQVIARAKAQLTVVRESAAAQAKAIYDGLTLPDLLVNSEAQARGSVPQEILDIWANLDPAKRRQLLEAVAADVMSDWPPGTPRPKVIFYSNANPLPPGAVRPPDPNDDWSGNNGVAMDGNIYLNYDIMANPNERPVLLSTVVHELQHVEQGRMSEQYRTMVAKNPQLVADIRAGRTPDPFHAQGSTIDEVARWQVPYEGGGKPRYQYQPTEIDSRRAGTEYLDNLTPAQVQELLA